MEAAMVLPVTILIMAALILLLLRFYTDFQNQAELHRQERNGLYELKETRVLRIKTNLYLSGEEDDG